MTFNSWIFWIFFGFVIATYYSLQPKYQAQNLMLLVASYIFYGVWDWRFIFLLSTTTLVDYVVALQIHKTKYLLQRKLYLIISCTYNLGVLCFFKYFNFFIDSASNLLTTLGLPLQFNSLAIILPLGISFYTFQSMSYVIDVYLQKITPLQNPFNYALYVVFFPQLVAGPIERSTHFIPQLTHVRNPTRNQYIEGVWLILFGLYTKIVVADNLSIWVDKAFNSSDSISGVEALLAIYAFAFQIYGDFSGYSNMARGLAKLLGFELMVNFNRPYIATNPSDFWRRWHISLSTWLRDYLYIPLGGNRHGKLNTYRNLMMTMLLGGFWHGASWKFILWGAYQGTILVLYRLFSDSKVKLPDNFFLLYLSRIGMFHLTCLGWLLFRANNLEQVVNMLVAITTDFHLDMAGAKIVFPLLFFGGGLWLLEWWLDNADDPHTKPGWKNLGPWICAILLFIVVFLAAPEKRQFLYFQF